MIGKAREAMATQQLHQVLNAVWAVVADANRYFASEAPWALAKTDPKRQGTVLYVTAEVLRCVAIMAQPFVPSSAARMLDLLAIPAGERSFYELNGEKRIAPGRALPAPAPVFPRYVEPEAKAFFFPPRLRGVVPRYVEAGPAKKRSAPPLIFFPNKPSSFGGGIRRPAMQRDH